VALSSVVLPIVTATDRVDLPLMVATGTVDNDVDSEVLSATVVEWSTE